MLINYCALCEHSGVCKYEEQLKNINELFDEMDKKIDKVLDVRIFDIELKCRYYKGYNYTITTTTPSWDQVRIGGTPGSGNVTLPYNGISSTTKGETITTNSPIKTYPSVLADIKPSPLANAGESMLVSGGESIIGTSEAVPVTGITKGSNTSVNGNIPTAKEIMEESVKKDLTELPEKMKENLEIVKKELSDMSSDHVKKIELSNLYGTMLNDSTI